MKITSSKTLVLGMRPGTHEEQKPKLGLLYFGILFMCLQSILPEELFCEMARLLQGLLRHLVVTKSNCRRASPGYGLLLIRSSFIICLRKSSLKLPRTRKKPRFQKENVACHIHICKNISLNVAVKFLMRK